MKNYRLEEWFHFFLEYFKKIEPKDSDITSLRGFGYSFSNIGKDLDDNENPYFAVGVVNNDQPNFSRFKSSLVLFKTSPFCINMRPECKTSISINPNSLTRKDTGNFKQVIINWRNICLINWEFLFRNNYSSYWCVF